ncbi:ATP-binding protein [Streptomyces graminifolii]|uniref:ATP-binding protein n=1 Tax=Streptomyces graminifolii TaxID=1266771 RepID=UPI00405A0CDA
MYGGTAVVAGRDATVVEAPPARPVVIRGLPMDVAGFTGRETELAFLLATAEPGQVVSVHTVDGMPGVGKTALAIRAAHLLADRFPDGQYFYRLHAHTPGQKVAKPIDVLAVLLTELGIDPRSLPPTLEGRSDLWRDRLADKRVLLLLDDAADHAQIRPLLPGGPGCLTLVTSRKRLIALEGAHPLPVDPLKPDEAAALFTTTSQRQAVSSKEVEAVAEAVRLCGYLPLAIVLLASRLQHHPTWSIPRFVADFAQAQDRIGELAGGDQAVYSAFALSYQGLTSTEQHVFRYLALHPGPETDVYATAALTGLSRAQARHNLDVLYADHLLEETAPGRYRLHDLLRAYAKQHAEMDDAQEHRERAVERLLDYYQRTAQSADRHPLARLIRPSPLPPVEPSPVEQLISSRGAALAWMRIEHINLLACLQYVTPRSNQGCRVIHLTSVMASFLMQGGPWPEAAFLHQSAADIARKIGDRCWQAGALIDLGRIRALMGQYKAALNAHEKALTLYEELHYPLGQATALDDLGRVHNLLGEYDKAISQLKRSCNLYRDLGESLGQANALNDMGRSKARLGMYKEAEALHQQAFFIFQETGSQLGQGDALNELGRARSVMGEFESAIDLHRRALGIFTNLDSRLGQAYSLIHMSRTQILNGDHNAAISLLWRAHKLFRDLGNREGEADAMNEMGRAWAAIGYYQAAYDFHQRALHIFREDGDIQGSADVFLNIGALMTATSRTREAASYYNQSLNLARQVASPLTEARALEGLACGQARQGQRATALQALHQSLDIYRRIGAWETNPVAELLAAWESEEKTNPSHTQDPGVS